MNRNERYRPYPQREKKIVKSVGRAEKKARGLGGIGKKEFVQGDSGES